jgi:hypothetical protein
MKCYEVHTRFGHTWENVWTQDDAPLTFHSRIEAEREIAQHLADMKDAFARGDMSDDGSLDDFRIVQVEAA